MEMGPWSKAFMAPSTSFKPLPVTKRTTRAWGGISPAWHILTKPAKGVAPAGSAKTPLEEAKRAWAFWISLSSTTTKRPWDWWTPRRAKEAARG